MAEPSKGPQLFAVCSVCIGAMAAGTVLGWTGTITDNLKTGDLNGFKMDDDVLGWAGSSMTIGAMLMCLPCGFLADIVGRKPLSLFCIIPYTIGWAAIIMCKSILMLCIGRFLVGLASGAFFVTAPLYTGEIAHVSIRGALGTMFQLFITIGILFSYVLGAMLPINLFCACCAVIPIVFGVFFIFQPESPAYYLKKNNPEKAKATMARLRGSDYDPAGELSAMQGDIDKSKAAQSWFESMKKPNSIKAFVICNAFMFYQQLSGINAVIFYMSDILKAGGSKLGAKESTIIVGVVQVLACLIASFFIEKVGRRILLILSSILMAGSTFLIGFFYSMDKRQMVSPSTLQSLGFIPVLSLVLFIIAFSFGYGPIPWLASSELFTSEIKPICSSIAATFNWFLAFCVTRFYFNIANAIGTDLTFYIFAAISATGILFVLIFVPETKGKTVQEIQIELGGS